MSGEALAGEGSSPVSREAAKQLAAELVSAADAGVEIGVVVGGGNIVRGIAAERSGVDRVTADYMGMAATVVNGLALADALREAGRHASVMSALPGAVGVDAYDRHEADSRLRSGEIVIFVGGTGNPFFSTDTAAVLRACELGADLLLKGTQVDGVYDSDPATNPDARRFDVLTYQDVLEKRLAVMDMTAVSLAREENLPIVVFALSVPGNVARIVSGEAVGTRVKGV